MPFPRLRKMARRFGTRVMLGMRKSTAKPLIQISGMVTRSRLHDVSTAPKYLKKDITRAKKMGVRTNYVSSRSAGRSHAYKPGPAEEYMKAHIFAGGRKSRQVLGQHIGGSRASNLSVYRHELGHQEAFRSKRDRQRIARFSKQETNARAHRLLQNKDLSPAWITAHSKRRSQREEMLGWKNAIRASPNANVHWPTLKTALSTYHARKNLTIDPRFNRSVKTLQRYQRYVRHVRRKKA